MTGLVVGKTCIASNQREGEDKKRPGSHILLHGHDPNDLKTPN